MTQRTCVTCDGPLTGQQRKYCSKPCAIKADTNRRRESGSGRARAYTRDKVCAACERSFRGKAAQAYCSPACARATVVLALHQSNRKTTALVPYQRPRTWSGTHVTGGTWTQGPCAYCGRPFTSATGRGRYCTSRCKANAKSARKYKLRGEFALTPRERRMIFERDNWTCQLCLTAIERDAHYLAPLSATLDHIVPQSLSLIPDHSPSNLRAAHRLCNAQRGNRLDWTPAIAA